MCRNCPANRGGIRPRRTCSGRPTSVAPPPTRSTPRRFAPVSGAALHDFTGNTGSSRSRSEATGSSQQTGKGEAEGSGVRCGAREANGSVEGIRRKPSMEFQVSTIVIDADAENRQELAQFLTNHGIQVFGQFASAEQVATLLGRQDSPQLVI